jgi:predicted ArsR family transcriptional regulator
MSTNKFDFPIALDDQPDPPKARTTDPDTSHIADAMLTKERKGHLHREILRLLATNDDDLTQRQISDMMGEEMQTCTPRFAELEEQGLITKVRKVTGEKGRPVYSYRITTSEERLSQPIVQQKKKVTIDREQYDRLLAQGILLRKIFDRFPNLRNKEYKVEADYALGEEKKPVASVTDRDLVKERA